MGLHRLIDAFDRSRPAAAYRDVSRQPNVLGFGRRHRIWINTRMEIAAS